MVHVPSRALWMLAPLALIFLAGCPTTTPWPPEQPVHPEGTYSVHQLAGLLHMRVDQSSRSVASLRSVSGRVTIFGGASPKVLVNGIQIGDGQGVQAVEGTLFVPREYLPAIEATLSGEEAPRPGPLRTDPRRIATTPPAPIKVTTPTGNVRGLVMLDPGHGAHDPGTHSPFNPEVKEKDINLRVANMTAEDLKAMGASVIMTRNTDVFIELNERPEMANSHKVDVFVSIHTNSAQDSAARGFGVYVSRSASSQSVAAANAISRRLVEAGVIARNEQPIHENFRVLSHNDRPAVLVEIGFLTNRSEAVQLNSADYQQRLARAIAAGIADFLHKK